MAADTAINTEDLWTEFHANLLRFVGRRVRNHADAEDVVQRVFLQVHRALPTLRDADRIHAWMYQTTRRVIADYYRAPIQRREVPAGGVDDFADRAADEGDDELTALGELAACLRPLMSGLASVDQEALSLVEFDGVSQVQAAARLGVSTSGMKSRVQRARHRLREAVEECCRVELNRRGGLAGFAPRSGCGCGQDRSPDA